MASGANGIEEVADENVQNVGEVAAVEEIAARQADDEDSGSKYIGDVNRVEAYQCALKLDALFQVKGRLSASHRNVSYNVTKEEIQRRMSSPEKLNVTNVENILHGISKGKRTLASKALTLRALYF